MKLKEIKKTLEKYANYVIQQARSNLTKDGSNVNKKLYDSLDKNIDSNKNAIVLSFLMEDYGKFQDQGVKGANPSSVVNGRQKAPDSDFSFKSKMPPMQPLANWAKIRKIRFRDPSGRFAEGDYKRIGFWIQKRIFAQGIEATAFFSKPFEQGLIKYQNELLEAFGNDIDIELGFKK
jgi:hypothetical protein